MLYIENDKNNIYFEKKLSNPYFFTDPDHSKIQPIEKNPNMNNFFLAQDRLTRQSNSLNEIRMNEIEKIIKTKDVIQFRAYPYIQCGKNFGDLFIYKCTVCIRCINEMEISWHECYWLQSDLWIIQWFECSA